MKGINRNCRMSFPFSLFGTKGFNIKQTIALRIFVTLTRLKLINPALSSGSKDLFFQRNNCRLYIPLYHFQDLSRDIYKLAICAMHTKLWMHTSLLRMSFRHASSFKFPLEVIEKKLLATSNIPLFVH